MGQSPEVQRLEELVLGDRLFSTVAAIRDTPVVGTFTRVPTLINPARLLQAMVRSSGPTFSYARHLLSFDPDQSDTVQIDGDTWAISDVEPNGDSMRLILQRQ